MRFKFSLLLLFLIFESVLAAKSLRRRMAAAARAIRIVTERKRKLESTDEEPSDNEGGTPPGNYNETGSDQPESGDAAANGTTVDDGKPASSQGREIENKTADVHVMKFHSYRLVSKKIFFGVYLYFRNRPISRYIVFRLRISYFSSLRNLLEDSVPSNCTIVNGSLADTTPEETKPATVDYICEATPIQDVGKIKNVSLNTDFEMQLSKKDSEKLIYENFNFSGINFNGNSSQESQSIQEQRTGISDSVSLKDTVGLDEKNTLKLTGTFDFPYKLDDGNDVFLSILTEKNGENVNIGYNCKVKQTSPEGILECDTSSNPLNTTIEKMHLSTGTTKKNTLVTVFMKDYKNNNTPIRSNGGHRYTYNKSSSGLSGGAIAGIVIACVVVLLAASIAAIMLRKPAPPIDNTTVVGLKTVENI